MHNFVQVIFLAIMFRISSPTITGDVAVMQGVYIPMNVMYTDDRQDDAKSLSVKLTVMFVWPLFHVVYRFLSLYSDIEIKKQSHFLR
jgi:hypothetical protein